MNQKSSLRQRRLLETAVVLCGATLLITVLVGVVAFFLQGAKLTSRVATVCAITMGSGLALSAVAMLAVNSLLKGILGPVQQISEKAQRIAGGSYGVQIPGPYPGELGELADNINDMSAAISQNEKSQTEFISSLSHELRTPLTVITGWSETLVNSDDLDPDTQRGMNIILRESRRLNEMVIDLLDFTRMGDGRLTLNIEPADLRSEFEDTVFMYGNRLRQDGLELIYLDNDSPIPIIDCDAKRMRQVFLNILDNAAKHGGEGRRIEASICYEEPWVTVRIRDYGCGIPEDEIPLVKNKFFKGSSKARGTGIGLAVSDEIVAMHGGTLSLSNAPGGGTLVTVRLPDSQ